MVAVAADRFVRGKSCGQCRLLLGAWGAGRTVYARFVGHTVWKERFIYLDQRLLIVDKEIKDVKFVFAVEVFILYSSLGKRS